MKCVNQSSNYNKFAVMFHETRSDLRETTNGALTGYVKHVVWGIVRTSTQVLLFRQIERPVLDALRETELGWSL